MTWLNDIVISVSGSGTASFTAWLASRPSCVLITDPHVMITSRSTVLKSYLLRQFASVQNSRKKRRVLPDYSSEIYSAAMSYRSVDTYASMY